MRHRLPIPQLHQAFRLSLAIAILSLAFGGLTSIVLAQAPYSVRPILEKRVAEPSLFDAYLREWTQAQHELPIVFLLNQTEPAVSETPPAIESATAPEEQLEYTDPLDNAPPGAMLFDEVHHWFANTPFFGHGVEDVRDPRRHWGVGVPLEGTSWRNRPWHFGMFFGMLDGGEVLDGQVLQDSGLFWGLRLGNDFDHYWGWELRAGTAHVDLNRTDTGVPLEQDGRNSYYDLNLLYYPLGDTRWRPYVSLGIGASTHGFADLDGNSFDETTASMPLALGIKYFVRPGYSLRADFTNNVSFGTGNASGTNNISLSVGFDLHFGGRRKVYYPYDPSIQVW